MLISACAGLAHSEIAPSPAPIGSARFVISVPKDSVNVPITGFRLRAPSNVTIDKAESKDGFDAVSDGRNVRWRGGSVAAKSTAKFEFTATIPSDTPLVIFEGEEFYGKFESGSFALSVPQYG